MRKNKDKNKRNIWKYLKNYKIWIFLYVFITIIAAAGDIFITIMLANAVEIITIPNYTKALYILLGVIGISIIQRLCWYFLNWIYYKYSNKIMMELNADLAKQAFKLNSKTYNDHDTGTFVQRLVEDPAQIVDSLATVVDMIMGLITEVVMLIYIMTLNIWVALILLAMAIIAGFIEFKRVKIRRKNRFAMRKKNDLVQSLTTEIVRSEKDIKSLGLEEKLSEVSKKYFESYRASRYKLDITRYEFLVT